MNDTNEVISEIRERMERPDLRAADFKKDEKGRFIFPLEFPFLFGTREVTELRLRKPKTKQIKKTKT